MTSEKLSNRWRRWNGRFEKVISGFSQLQQELSVCKREPQPERHQGISDEVQRGIEDRLAKIEGRLTRHQQQTSGWQEDSVRDFQAVEAYMDRVHKMIQEVHQAGASQPTPKRPRLTRLTAAAMKGDLRVEVEESDTFRVGEVVVLGEREAKMVIGKGSLIFRLPIEGDYPEGTVIRPLADDEFLQAEGDRLCVYPSKIQKNSTSPKFFSFWAFFSAEKFGFCILP